MAKVNPKAPYGTIDIDGVDVPLTKNGYPNKKYMKKALREALDEYQEKNDKEKLGISIEKLKDALKKLNK